MLRSSRGLAHRSSAFGRLARRSSARCICGTGSTPVSAIRPANTDTIAGVERLGDLADLIQGQEGGHIEGDAAGREAPDDLPGKLAAGVGDRDLDVDVGAPGGDD